MNEKKLKRLLTEIQDFCEENNTSYFFYLEFLDPEKSGELRTGFSANVYPETVMNLIKKMIQQYPFFLPMVEFVKSDIILSSMMNDLGVDKESSLRID